MMIKNSEGDHAVIVDMSRSKVKLNLYRNKTSATTPSNWFDPTIEMNFDCGEELALAINTEETTPGVTKAEDAKITAYNVIVAQALEDPEKHRPRRDYHNPETQTHEVEYKAGDWEIVV